jgi:hypothetical protein
MDAGQDGIVEMDVSIASNPSHKLCGGLVMTLFPTRSPFHLFESSNEDSPLQK